MKRQLLAVSIALTVPFSVQAMEIEDTLHIEKVRDLYRFTITRQEAVNNFYLIAQECRNKFQDELNNDFLNTTAKTRIQMYEILKHNPIIHDAETTMMINSTNFYNGGQGSLDLLNQLRHDKPELDQYANGFVRDVFSGVSFAMAIRNGSGGAGEICSTAYTQAMRVWSEFEAVHQYFTGVYQSAPEAVVHRAMADQIAVLHTVRRFANQGGE